MNRDQPGSNKVLWRYAGLATQFLVIIGLGLFIGLKADKWLRFSMPLFVWILPLLIIVGMIIIILKDTAKKDETKK